jgi:hypothetical protein
MGSSMWAQDQTGTVPELTKVIDSSETGELVEIEPDQTPEGNTKVTTTSKTTKTTKKVKLKTKSKKTYSKKSAAKKNTKTSKKKTKAATTTTKTVTTTQMTSSFKKGSNINTQVTTKKVTTTTTVVAAATAVKTTAAEKTTVALSNAAPKLTSNVASAYTALNFKIIIDPSVSYSGLFDARSQTITLKTLDDTVYHELGHFLAFVAGNIDTTSAFQSIYAQEQSKYTAFNKAYVLQNASEYFAESYKNYIQDPAALKASRPQTYAVIEQALAYVTDAQVAKLKLVYGSIWTL